MPLKLTPLMKKRLTPRAQQMISRSLVYFPELAGKLITVGYTRKHLGSATVVYHAGAITRLIIRLKVRKLTYQTIGHELTHLLQGLSRGERANSTPLKREKIPAGEKQCDIWTLARHELFCDDTPTYIRMPRFVRECWPDYAVTVRQLCVDAIQKRNTHRLYIHWLESEIDKLPKVRARQNVGPMQLALPFTTLVKLVERLG